MTVIIHLLSGWSRPRRRSSNYNRLPLCVFLQFLHLHAWTLYADLLIAIRTCVPLRNGVHSHNLSAFTQSSAKHFNNTVYKSTQNVNRQIHFVSLRSQPQLQLRRQISFVFQPTVWNDEWINYWSEGSATVWDDNKHSLRNLRREEQSYLQWCSTGHTQTVRWYTLPIPQENVSSNATNYIGCSSLHWDLCLLASDSIDASIYNFPAALRY